MRRLHGSFSPWFPENDTMVTAEIMRQWVKNVIGAAMFDPEGKERGKVVKAEIVGGNIHFVAEVEDLVLIDEITVTFCVGQDLSLAPGQRVETHIMHQHTEIKPPEVRNG